MQTEFDQVCFESCSGKSSTQMEDSVLEELGDNGSAQVKVAGKVLSLHLDLGGKYLLIGHSPLRKSLK